MNSGDRQGKELAEREMEREREKVKKDKDLREERDRQEKDFQERQDSRQERQRVFMKTQEVNPAAAVNQHFIESLKRASQRSSTVWPSPSITLGTGKGFVKNELPTHSSKSSVFSHNVSNQDPLRPENKIDDKADKFKYEKDTQQDGHVNTQRLACIDKAHDASRHPKHHKDDRLIISHQNKTFDGHRSEMKSDPSQGYSSHPENLSPHQRTSLIQVKQEPNFSLYGYQPYQHSYISSDQLSLRGLTDKNTSRNERSHEPALQPDSTVKRKDLSVPPPLIKDGKPHNSVIVENKCRDGAKSVSPHNSLYGSPAAQSSKSISPTSLSYSDRIPDRTMTFSTSAPSVSYGSPHINSQSPRQAPSAHSSLSAFLITDKSRSQSPLQVASPQQLSAAVMQQPIDYRKTPPNNSNRNISTTNHNVQVSNTSPQCSSNSSQHLSSSPYSNSSNSLQNNNQRSITVISPHMSQNAITLAHSYMVPSHSVVASSRESAVHVVSHSHATQLASKTYPPIVSSRHTNVYTTSNTPVSIKRKPVRENNNRKKIKPAPTAKIAPTSVTVPVTTPQILFNPSPYTTSSSSVTTFHPTVSIPASVSVPTSGSILLSSATRASGYMDSFRSFVENTVQNAFYQETADMPSTQNLQSRITETEKQVPSAAIAIPSPVPPQRNKDVTSSVPPALRPPPPPPHVSSSPLTTTSPIASPGKGSSTTSTTITTSAVGTDSTSRVVNGLIDTDSDTLSAPSPPPPPPKPDTCASPGRSGNHPKLKKAWLQRHSDEDKVKENKPMKDDAGAEMGDVLKTCYVNCSYISPSKGGSKSPITSIRLANGTIKDLDKDSDESTSSASETDVQNEDECSTGSKRHQHTYSQIDAKRIKTEVDSKNICEESIYSTKKKNTLGKVKLEGQISKASDAEDYSNAEDSGENYADSDVKDEASDSGSCSPRDSDIGFKEKRRNRRHKDFNEENICVNAGRQPSKTSVALLKRTGEPFLQDGACREVTPKLMKCRECRLTPTQRSKKLPNIFCRFYEFRKLRYSQKGFLMIAGFSELSDANSNDIKPWDPNLPVKSPEIDVNIAKYILSKVGDKFCDLVEHEKEARSWAGKEAKVAWKRAVTGVREMCDVCDTTLFNIHWVCHKCGFVVCLDCYKSRRELKDEDAAEKKVVHSEHEWLTCSANRQPHEPEKLMLTQIIPSNALWDLGHRIHEIRRKWNIKSNCTCEKNLSKNGVNQEDNKETENHVSSENTKMPNGTEDNCNSGKNKKMRTSQPEKLSNYNPDANSPLCLLADVAMNSENSRDRTDPLLNKKEPEEKKSNIQEPLSPNAGGTDKKTPGCSTLRELLTKSAGKVKPGADSKKSSKPKTVRDTLEDIIQSVVGKAFPKENETVPMMKLMHYIPRMGPRIIAREIPILKHTLTETSVLYPDVPHSWLCDGRLLRLHEPKHKNNLSIFQEQWKLGSPVLVSGVQRYLKSKIWKPESFCEQFGHIDNDLVNCRTGDVWIGHSMKVFWDGFEYIRKRLRDKNNDPMLLKLKDWPPSDDFSDILPQRFLDLMQALPLPDYTNRLGILNLASRLPDFLVKPDLGPKMYNAYGSASFPSEGTTNLHLDVSDAVNVMVHVGIPDDGPNGRQDHIDAALKAIDEADCDIITKQRVREVNEIPGALWHIYCAEEADKIRDLLNKVGKENGQQIEPDHDPIHDQSWYLDSELRDRLNKEYGVHGYTIVQCLGDAVFIPAGAPHQVRNLHSCIKVAEDFVSPEHLNHCFRMTQEFRHLSDSHSNHEDKLQVKNIIYHAVKDAIAVLNNTPVE